MEDNPMEDDDEETYDDGLALGRGTLVKRETASVVVDHKDRERDVVFVKITQTIHLSITVPINQNDLSWCQICGKVPPLPDEEGAEFILENNDGARISFPHAENCERERDRYPVAGWKDITIGEKNLFACNTCSENIDKHIALLKLRKR